MWAILLGYSIAHMHCQLRFLAHTTGDDTKYIIQSGRIHVVSTSDINVCQFRLSNYFGIQYI